MTKGTIVFLAVNASYAHTNLAGWYLRAAAVRAGWAWHEIEAVRTDPFTRLLQGAAGLEPDILAVSFYIFNTGFLGDFLPRFKALAPRCVVIGGGPEFLGDNAPFLERHPEVNLVVRGEGEAAFGAWLEVWREPSRWNEIRGVCTLAGGRYFDGGKSAAAENLDAIPTPFGRLGSFSKPFLLMEASRGCSGSCAFCTSAGERVRCFSEGRFRADLGLIAAAGVKEVRLADRTFNEHPARCARFIRIMRDEFRPIRFHLEIDPARLEDEAVAELAAAGPGRFHLEIGLQATRPEALRAMGRSGSLSKAMAALRKLSALVNISLHVDLIAGLPGTSLADLFDSLRQAAAMKPDEIQVELLKVLPGTRLAREAGKLGIIASPAPPYEVLRTAEMSHDELAVSERLSRLVDWFYNPRELHRFFIAALEADPKLPENLADYALKETAAVQAPALENRFRLLEAYCRGKLPALVPRLAYEWLKWGLSPQNGICRAVPWKKPLPAGAMLVEGAGFPEPGRIYLAGLEKPYLFVYSRSSGRRPCAIYACND